MPCRICDAIILCAGLKLCQRHILSEYILAIAINEYIKMTEILDTSATQAAGNKITYNVEPDWLHDALRKRIKGEPLLYLHSNIKDNYKENLKNLSELEFPIPLIRKAESELSAIKNKYNYFIMRQPELFIAGCEDFRLWIDRYISTSEIKRLQASFRKKKQRSLNRILKRIARVETSKPAELIALAGVFKKTQKGVVDMMIGETHQRMTLIEEVAKARGVEVLDIYAHLQHIIDIELRDSAPNL